jgi:hypothetical protein
MELRVRSRKASAAWRAMKGRWPGGPPRSLSFQEIANIVNNLLGGAVKGVSAKKLSGVIKIEGRRPRLLVRPRKRFSHADLKALIVGPRVVTLGLVRLVAAVIVPSRLNCPVYVLPPVQMLPAIHDVTSNAGKSVRADYQPQLRRELRR